MLLFLNPLGTMLGLFGAMLAICGALLDAWGLGWGHVEPMLNPCWAENGDHVSFCSAVSNPDLRKIRSGLENVADFGSCRGHVGPYGTYVGYMLDHVGCLGAILGQC